MKKILLAWLLIVCLLLPGALAACDRQDAPTTETTLEDIISQTNTPSNSTPEPEACVHTWVAADCDTPKTCSICNATEGAALGHTWVNADCDTPKTCSVCNATEGNALGHAWKDATTETPKTCTVCGATEGQPLPPVTPDPTPGIGGGSSSDWGNGEDVTDPNPEECNHSWVAADCDTAKTCSKCNMTEGEALGHDMVTDTAVAPTCTETGLTAGAHCLRCNDATTAQTVVPATGHTWVDATTEAPKTCTGCGATEGQPLPSYPRPSEVRTYALTEDTAGIKVLGERRAKVDGCITMDWTASGIEFNVDLNTKSTISFVAKASANCYYKAYIDGELYKNGTSDYFTVGTAKTTIELTNVPYGKHTVRLVKATGYTLALSEVYSVTLDGTISETAPAQNDLYIEFLGDSITCGWGVVGDRDGNYTSQDGTLAYPYRLATALNADYSILGLSGKGVIYGTPNFDQNYIHTSPLRSTSDIYDFARKADIVVINLGTNEQGNGASATEFQAGYLRLLEAVFEKNGEDCVVYCLYGAMNDAYFPQAQNAINEYLKSHPNAKIYTFKLDASTTAGGSPSWGHPGSGDNMKYYMKLKKLIDQTYLPAN